MPIVKPEGGRGAISDPMKFSQSHSTFLFKKFCSIPQVDVPNTITVQVIGINPFSPNASSSWNIILQILNQLKQKMVECLKF